MVILKYELKRHRKLILGWAIALALCVFVMTPTYYSFMDVSTGDLYETLGTSDFYKGVGVSMEYLTSPLGIYAFLTSFFMIASGIFGMHFGIAIHTKECSERTSEYLFTKPHTRKTIYWAKAFTVFFGVVVVSMVYLLASFLALALFRSALTGRVLSDCSFPHAGHAVPCSYGAFGWNSIFTQSKPTFDCRVNCLCRVLRHQLLQHCQQPCH